LNMVYSMRMQRKAFALAVGLLIASAAEARDCEAVGHGWEPFLDTKLGVFFCRPPNLVAQVEGRDIYLLANPSGPHKPNLLTRNHVDLLLNGRRLLDPNDYAVHIKLGSGDFDAANAAERIFIDDQGVVRAGIGRFKNVAARYVSESTWVGYKTLIACSTSDPVTGFHAAGGDCLWIIGANGRQNFVLDTLGDPTDAKLAWKVAKSLMIVSPQ